MGKHSAVPASSGETPWPRDSWSAEGRHSTGEFSRGELDLPEDPIDEPIELLAEPLTEELHEPLAPTAPRPVARVEPAPQPPVERPMQHRHRGGDAPVSSYERPAPPRPAGARHAATPSAPREAPEPPRRGVATYALAAVLTALAWGVLVYYAIQLGPDVKDGEGRAWALMIVATIGAMACLFLSMILGGRVVEVWRGSGADAQVDEPLKPVGGRRAKR